jgi:DNA-binding GntR family transcriptional regulator
MIFSGSSVSEEVALRIRAHLASGELNPGDRLWEADLARAYGVSRTSIRNAFALLASDGLLVSRPNRGTFVAPLRAKRFEDLVDLRLVLEELAVRRLATRVDEDAFAQLEVAVAELRASAGTGGFAEVIVADMAFHKSLIELADNRPLRDSYAALIHELQLYIRLTCRHYTSIGDLALEHEAFIDALRAGHVEVAIEALRHHIMHGFDGALEDLQWNGPAPEMFAV